MDFIYERIHVPLNRSFVTRKHHHKDPPQIHSHKNYELNFVIDGCGKRIVGNSISTFEEGDLVLLGPDLPHCWDTGYSDNPPQPASITIHFLEDLIKSDLFHIAELVEVEVLLKKAHVGIWFKGPQVRKIERHLKRLVNLKGLESFIELLKVFQLLLEVEDLEYLSDTGYSPTFIKDVEKVNLVYEYVFQNIQTGIRQEDAAALLHMTPGAFCRYFKKRTTQTFMEYVKSVRIRLALKMLAETDKPISRICYESGYNNIANFNHQFRNTMHTTPSKYRKVFRS